MVVKLPALVAGITVPTGGAAIRYTSTAGAATVTVPAGTYWADMVLGAIKAIDSACALGQLAYLIDTADTGSTYTAQYNAELGSAVATEQGWDGFDFRYSTLTRAAGVVQLLPTNAATTAAGKRFLEALGFASFVDSASAAGINGLGMIPFWASTRGETGDVDEFDDAFAATVRAYGGVAYGFQFGRPLARRIVTLDAVPGSVARMRVGRFSSAADGADPSLEGLIWERVMRGEPLRYYADPSVAAAYLSSGMTATQSTAVLDSATGFAAGDTIWIDGERCFITSTASAPTIDIQREQRWATTHAKYSPVSQDFVGTYHVDEDGGNCNALGFKPERRGINQDRWDIEIPLVRTLM